MTKKQLFFALSVFALLSYLYVLNKPHPLYIQTFYVFGTTVSVTIADTPKNKARDAVNHIAQDFQTMHQHWHAWKPSQLSDLNQAIAAGKSQMVSQDLLYLVEISKQMAQKSEHLFNPAISHLIAAWGFHGTDSEQWTPLNSDEIHKLVHENPKMDDIETDGDWVSSRNHAVQLDFGGIAKGYAVDIALHYLKSQGIHNAIINAGGNLGVIGYKQKRFWQTTPWTIGVRHPNGQDVLARLEAQPHEMLFSSGNYERYHQYQGKRYTHIINPNTGYPINHITTATVMHHNGAVADAASTALAIAGVDKAAKIAKQMGIKAYLLMDDNDVVYMNPSMAKRAKFYPNNSLTIKLLKDDPTN